MTSTAENHESTVSESTATRFSMTPLLWVACVVAIAAALGAFREGLQYMLTIWGTQDEYSHAYLIPVISLFLIWQNKNELARLQFRGSWLGAAIAVLGVGIGFLGKLATVFTLQQFGMVLAIVGAVWSLVGWAGVRLLWMPLLLLFLMIPLPQFLQQNFSAGMQLLSSQIGVWFIRLMGISVYLEGNVIDLGTFKLQVAEACDGLRYLFPLMTLGLVLAWFYKGATWKRALIFLSSIPITILMNSLRIATIGWMVEHWGIRMAEGFLHDFQGWAVFMVSFGLMVLLMIALSKVGKDRRHWREVFGLDFPAPEPPGIVKQPRTLPASALAACAVLVLAALATFALPKRAEVIPARSSFVDFPMVIGPWLGQRGSVEPVYIDALKFDDYVFAHFRGPSPRPVNFYVAWYDSQQAGRSVHSPRSCIPGGGWQIKSLTQATVPGVTAHGQPLRVNRALIAFGDNRQLVYYWFQQRGRVLTNEYLVKWYLFWDSLTRKRSDGSLVRLIVPLGEGTSEQEADRDLARFATDVMPVLEAYVPN